MVSQLLLYVRESDGTIRPDVLKPSKVDVVARHLGVGTWGVTLKSADDAALLAQPGAGVLFRLNDAVVMSGKVTGISQTYADNRWEWVVTGLDDAVLLDVLGWPVPGNAIGSQTSSAWTDTDVAETVMKGFVSANVVTRLGIGVTVATDSGRGSSITGRSRMASVLELLREWGLSGGLGWQVVDAGSGPVFDVYAPTDRTGTVYITPQMGAVLSLTYRRAAPEATRVVVGDAGTATSRVFRAVTDTSTETEWALIREQLVDSRQTTSTAEMDQAGNEHLAENGDTTAVSVVLRDVPGQEYGVHYELGDQVPVSIDSGTTITDVVWEVAISYDQSSGLTVSPTVGKPDDVPTTRRLRTIGSQLRNLMEAQ